MPATPAPSDAADRPDPADGPDPADRRAAIDEVRHVARALGDAVSSVIEGKPEVVETAVTALLAGGHLLVEDVPGVGKTMLAKTLARAIDAPVSRIQFTPDLLPSDITGVDVFSPERRDFDFRPGAVFASIVIGDEINRASPKTQSALLECMEEGQVTLDGKTHPLPRPFLVVATQNPIEMEGTYPLPEAQRDRFMMQISMGYPSARAEVEMLDQHAGANPLEDLAPVTDAATVERLVDAVRAVHASEAVRQYIVDLATATRRSRDLRLGASPRATLQLLRAARAHAALQDRDHVLPDDVQRLAIPVLSHRLILSGTSTGSGHAASDVLDEILRRVPVPATARG